MEDTLKIRSISTNGKYSERDLLEKIDFTMSDSTALNLKLIEKVCEDFDVDKVPSSILCNVHHLMMFQSMAYSINRVGHVQSKVKYFAK